MHGWIGYFASPRSGSIFGQDKVSQISPQSVKLIVVKKSSVLFRGSLSDFSSKPKKESTAVCSGCDSAEWARRAFESTLVNYSHDHEQQFVFTWHFDPKLALVICLRALALGQRRLLANAPELGGFANDFGEFGKSGWFMKVGVCAKVISAENILLLARGGKDNDGNDMAIRMSTEPFENVKAGAAGHF